jgi:GNAT superfamily N-acetyltransferase
VPERFAPVAEAERERAIATLVSAFRDDPVERWLYPGEAEYRRCFPAFVKAFGGDAFGDQTVWRLGDFDAVAFWFGPSREPDGEAIVQVLLETTTDDRHADSFATLEQMAAAHPAQPHWYLPWFGVDRSLQGHGLGTELMRCCLNIVDKSRLPAYLETPNPRTVRFYERAGFVVAGTAAVGACPPVTMMHRTRR